LPDNKGHPQEHCCAIWTFMLSKVPDLRQGLPGCNNLQIVASQLKDSFVLLSPQELRSLSFFISALKDVIRLHT
jgi:hypothetical protein